MSGTLDFRKENSEIVQEIKKRSNVGHRIVRNGRVSEFSHLMEQAIKDFHDMDYEECRSHLNQKYTIFSFDTTTKRGASKVCINVDKSICIRKDVNENGWGKQVLKEVELYQALLSNKAKTLKWLVPILRYYPKENISITPYCDVVCSLEEACRRTGHNARVVMQDLKDSGIATHDLHEYNCGILYGKPVVLDYGLCRMANS